MPDAVSDRFGMKTVVVLDATATDNLKIDFDLGSARFYLLGGDLIARTITDRMIIMARLEDAVVQRPTMIVSTVGGPTVTAKSLLERASNLGSIAQLFTRLDASQAARPSDG